MSPKTVHVSLAADLVAKIDKVAISEYSTRSDYIRKAIVNQLHADANRGDLKRLLSDLAEDITDSAIAIDSPYNYSSFKDFVQDVMAAKDSVLYKYYG